MFHVWSPLWMGNVSNHLWHTWPRWGYFQSSYGFIPYLGIITVRLGTINKRFWEATHMYVVFSSIFNFCFIFLRIFITIWTCLDDEWSGTSSKSKGCKFFKSSWAQRLIDLHDRSIDPWNGEVEYSHPDKSISHKDRSTIISRFFGFAFLYFSYSFCVVTRNTFFFDFISQRDTVK